MIIDKRIDDLIFKANTNIQGMYDMIPAPLPSSLVGFKDDILTPDILRKMPVNPTYDNALLYTMTQYNKLSDKVKRHVHSYLDSVDAYTKVPGEFKEQVTQYLKKSDDGDYKIKHDVKLSVDDYLVNNTFKNNVPLSELEIWWGTPVSVESLSVVRDAPIDEVYKTNLLERSVRTADDPGVSLNIKFPNKYLSRAGDIGELFIGRQMFEQGYKTFSVNEYSYISIPKTQYMKFLYRYDPFLYNEDAETFKVHARVVLDDNKQKITHGGYSFIMPSNPFKEPVLVVDVNDNTKVYKELTPVSFIDPHQYITRKSMEPHTVMIHYMSINAGVTTMLIVNSYNGDMRFVEIDTPVNIRIRDKDYVKYVANRTSAIDGDKYYFLANCGVLGLINPKVYVNGMLLDSVLNADETIHDYIHSIKDGMVIIKLPIEDYAYEKDIRSLTITGYKNGGSYTKTIHPDTVESSGVIKNSSGIIYMYNLKHILDTAIVPDLHLDIYSHGLLLVEGYDYTLYGSYLSVHTDITVEGSDNNDLVFYIRRNHVSELLRNKSFYILTTHGISSYAMVHCEVFDVLMYHDMWMTQELTMHNIGVYKTSVPGYDYIHLNDSHICELPTSYTSDEFERIRCVHYTMIEWMNGERDDYGDLLIDRAKVRFSGSAKKISLDKPLLLSGKVDPKLEICSGMPLSVFNKDYIKSRCSYALTDYWDKSCAGTIRSTPSSVLLKDICYKLLSVYETLECSGTLRYKECTSAVSNLVDELTDKKLHYTDGEPFPEDMSFNASIPDSGKSVTYSLLLTYILLKLDNLFIPTPMCPGDKMFLLKRHLLNMVNNLGTDLGSLSSLELIYMWFSIDALCDGSDTESFNSFMFISAGANVKVILYNKLNEFNLAETDIETLCGYLLFINKLELNPAISITSTDIIRILLDSIITEGVFKGFGIETISTEIDLSSTLMVINTLDIVGYPAKSHELFNNMRALLYKHNPDPDSTLVVDTDLDTNSLVTPSLMCSLLNSKHIFN